MFEKVDSRCGVSLPIPKVIRGYLFKCLCMYLAGVFGKEAQNVLTTFKRRRLFFHMKTLTAFAFSKNIPWTRALLDADEKFQRGLILKDGSICKSFHTYFRCPPGKKVPSKEDLVRYLQHFNLPGLTPSSLRHSAITNRVRILLPPPPRRPRRPLCTHRTPDSSLPHASSVRSGRIDVLARTSHLPLLRI